MRANYSPPICSPRAPLKPTRGLSSSSKPSSAMASSCPSASINKPSSFPASTAARNGAVQPSISRPASSTSTRTTSSGPAASPKTSKAAVSAQPSTRVSAPSATEAIAKELPQHFPPLSTNKSVSPTPRSPRSSTTAKAACLPSPTSKPRASLQYSNTSKPATTAAAQPQELLPKIRNPQRDRRRKDLRPQLRHLPRRRPPRRALELSRPHRRSHSASPTSRSWITSTTARAACRRSTN